MRKVKETIVDACSSLFVISLFFLCSVQIWSLAPVCHASKGVNLPSCKHESTRGSSFKVKAVNLGGWLVTEGWIQPSLFDGIPNNDLLDGTQFQLKLATTGKYLSAEKQGGNSILVVNRDNASDWETFRLWRINETTFSFKTFSDQFIGVQTDGGNRSSLIAVANEPGASETFQIVRDPDDPLRVRIQAPNSLFLQAKTQDKVTADYEGKSGWGDDNPSVFNMKIVNITQGEYQVTNGYGPEKAPQVMREHWSTFITEDDFEFISKHGLNTVRIPVGWWIASDPEPPRPFVGGSLRALDNAFSWAKKYDIKIIVDLHSAPGSQNGREWGSTRDGSLEWGKTDDTIQQTVGVIDFLAARYSTHPNFFAVELLNEPHAKGVNLTTLTKYYKLAYEAVRKHSSAYVVLCNRIGHPMDPNELFSFANSLESVVIDVHYYSLWASKFKQMTVQQNIEYIYNDRSSELSNITTSDGPLIFVGEWVAEWEAQTEEELERFASAQLQVYDKASFGWGYWTLKCASKHWSLEWMIKQGYINLTNQDCDESQLL